MKRKLTFPLAAALVAGPIALPASAQWYVGGSAGQSEIASNNAIQPEQFLDLGFLSASATSEKRDTAVRVFGGYQLHRNISLEAAYVDLGKFAFRANVMPTGTLDANTKINGFELAALGRLPISERLGAFARVGVLIAQTKTNYVGSGSVELITGTETQKKRSTQLSYGAGATFAINTRVDIRAEWARYTKLGNDLTGGRTDADLYSIGLTYRF